MRPRQVVNGTIRLPLSIDGSVISAVESSNKKGSGPRGRDPAGPPKPRSQIGASPGGNVRYALKTPYRDGTTHVIASIEQPALIERKTADGLVNDRSELSRMLEASGSAI